ncbi:signal peptide peptidase-like 2, partial [Tachysurus ichikawai]
MRHIKTQLPPSLDPLQFAYCPNRPPDWEAELLGLNTSLCNWILDFLTGRPQSVRIGNSISSTTTLSTGAPQGCMLSPLLFTLLTHDCAAMQIEPYHQVHDCGGSHQQERRVSIQRGGATANYLV